MRDRGCSTRVEFCVRTGALVAGRVATDGSPGGKPLVAPVGLRPCGGEEGVTSSDPETTGPCPARTCAEESTSTQVLTLYIPNKDRDGNEFGTQRKWVLEAAHLLAELGGGVTVMPACEGGWLNEASSRVVWEALVLVYTYIKPEPFVRGLGRLRAFLHRLGRETNQGEIGVEFDGSFYRITDFDPKGAP